MAQVAPGRYQAEFDTTRQGSYQLMFSQTQGLAGRRPADARAGRRLPGRAAAAADRTPSCCESIAGATGGQFDPKPEAVFDAAGADRSAGRAALALPGHGRGVLFVLDVALAGST